MEKQAKVIRAMLVGLPAGLALLGAASLTIYFSRGWIDAATEPGKGSLMQKPVEKKDLEDYVRILTEDIGDRNVDNPKGLDVAANYIEGSLGPQNMGYTVRRQTYEVKGVECHNVEVELAGTSRRDEIVVVGAHYDSVPGTVGANDNGSGVAALLSLANAFAGTKNARTVRFVAFVNEEAPHFKTGDMGSRRYARRCKTRGEDVVGMVCLETIGYFSDDEGSQSYPEGLEGAFPSAGNFIGFVANPESAALVETAAEAFRGTTDLPCEAGAFPEHVAGVTLSDHWSFWREGFPAFMVTDTAPFRYPHYHSEEDTADKLDYDRFFEVVRGMEGVVRKLANPE